MFFCVLTWICKKQDVGLEFRSRWDLKIDTDSSLIKITCVVLKWGWWRRTKWEAIFLYLAWGNLQDVRTFGSEESYRWCWRRKLTLECAHPTHISAAPVSLIKIYYLKIWNIWRITCTKPHFFNLMGPWVNFAWWYVCWSYTQHRQLLKYHWTRILSSTCQPESGNGFIPSEEALTCP